MKKRIVLFFLLSSIGFYIHAVDHFIIGHDEGEGELIYPKQVLEGPDGHIYIFDQSDAYIKKYSPEGKYIIKIGGKGEGPGEFKRVDGATFGFTPQNYLYFTEFFGGHKWITFVGLDGTFLRVVKLDIPGFFGVCNASVLEDGKILLFYDKKSEKKRTRDYHIFLDKHFLVLLNQDGKLNSHIYEDETAVYITPSSDGSGGTNIPFQPQFHWVFLNNRIIFSRGLSKNLNSMALTGKKDQNIPTPLPEPEPILKEDLDRWRESRREWLLLKNKSWYHQFGKVIEKYTESVYKIKSNLADMMVTPNGNIFLKGAPNPKTDGHGYYLISKRGESLSTLVCNAQNIIISEHFIFYKLKDEEGLIDIYCMKRKGKEVEDLYLLEEILKK